MADPGILHPIPSRDRGMTLLEVVVAALILGISITGVLSMLGSGRDQETLAFLRNQADKVAKNAMEDSNYTSAKYAGFAPAAKDWTFPAKADLSSETGTALQADVMVAVGPETVEWMFNPDLGAFGQAVPFRQVSVTVSWSFAGRNESVSLKKRIAEIR